MLQRLVDISFDARLQLVFLRTVPRCHAKGLLKIGPDGLGNMRKSAK